MSDESASPSPLDEAKAFLEGGPERTLASAGPHGRPGRLARRFLFRLLKPYTVRQNEFSRAVIEALEALGAEINRLEDELRDTEAERFERLRQLSQRLDSFERVTADALDRLAEREPSPGP